MNISLDKKWLILTIEESSLYIENKSLDEPYPEIIDSAPDLVRIPYRFKDRMDRLLSKK